MRNVRRIYRYSFTCAILFLGGCATPLETSPSSVPVVPVEAVINSLKCGFARALNYDSKGRSGLFGATAQVALDVNVIEGVDASGGITAGIPIFQGAGSFTPTFNLTHSETRTLNSSIDFEFDLRASNTFICTALEGGLEQDAGFSSWIGSVVTGINRAVAGPPRAKMTQYVYESDFTVKTATTLGADVVISPVKLNSSVGSSRSDIQHMKVSISAVSIGTDKNGKPVIIKGGKQFEPFGGRDRRGTFNRNLQ